ncbi:endo-1,3-alpha-glucanase family glycosylhydrolase [Microbacterium abyssi]|uniref:endo-1,3-alpha-glucanase family glycosylhydrolase n=1 Tax=Microbacterium abyssi TaxID=2782166 RepID=UPI0018889AAE|nr:endo-1,3-alpha-glucanase family glycosylhydrolase [Microbacterium sp. A18JL241]
MDTPPRTHTHDPISRKPRAVHLAVLAAFALVLGVILPASPLADAAEANAATSEVTLTATESTWTTSRKPTATHEMLPYLSMTAKQDRTYLKFDGAALKGQSIVSAKLVLRVATSAATEPGVTVHAASTSWQEQTLTHENRPADSTAQLNSTTPQARAGETITVPLRDLSALSTDAPFAFRLQYSQGAVGTTYVGAGPRAPQLVLQVEGGDPASVPSQPSEPQPTKPEPTPPATSSSGDKKVLAVYFPPYPLSLDNKPTETDYYTRNYLTVDGEGGAHAAYGGLLRDRPVPVGASTSPTWQVDNLRTEIRQAKSAGIDGFFVNVMSVSGLNWETTVNLFAAGELENFDIIPMVDGTTSISRLSPAQVASSLATLYESPAAMKVGADYLLSSFKAEGPGAAWWKEIISLLETKYDVPVSFQAVFLAASDANMTAFAPFSDSFGNWGERNPRVINKLPVYDDQAEEYGKDWMEPVAPQDMRPRLGAYAEAGNTEALRAAWSKAIRDDVEYVQMVTWNDYSESTQFAPSMAHGSAYLEISRYYSDWYHTGTAPRITEDQLFLTHRVQFASAVSSVEHEPIQPSLSGSKGDVRDTAEALVFLTAPATVEITVGGSTTRFDAPAGVSAFTAPLKVGSVQAKIIRAGAAVRTADSPYEVVDTPKVQDLQYYAVTGK